MKKLLRRIWFPKLRAAREDLKLLNDLIAWAQRSKQEMAARNLELRDQLREIRSENSDLRDENDSLRRALDALTSTAKKIDAWQVTQ